jgi:hypothetical protein
MTLRNTGFRGNISQIEADRSARRPQLITHTFNNERV